MAITKKPAPKASSEPAQAKVDDAKVIQLINKGGKPPQAKPSAERKVKNVQLRLHEDVLKSIDGAIERRSNIVKISRHNWLLEAISEKLDREGKS